MGYGPQLEIRAEIPWKGSEEEAHELLNSLAPPMESTGEKDYEVTGPKINGQECMGQHWHADENADGWYPPRDTSCLSYYWSFDADGYGAQIDPDEVTSHVAALRKWMADNNLEGRVFINIGRY